VGGCRGKYISTSDINRAIKSWEQEDFQKKVRKILQPGNDENPDERQINNEQLGSRGKEHQALV
jgi:hypothetical protein